MGVLWVAKEHAFSLIKILVNTYHMGDLFQEGSVGAPRNDAQSRVCVLVPYPVDKAYDYAVPVGMEVTRGDYVLVPLGPREVTGVVWGAAQDDVPSKKIKAILHKFPLQAMPDSHIDFIDWVANYTVAQKGNVLKMALSAPKALETPLTQTLYKISEKALTGKFTPTQQQVIDVMCDKQPRIQADIAREADVSAGVVKTLHKKGALTAIEAAMPPPCINANPDFFRLELSEAQESAARILRTSVSAEKSDVFVLDGVTGAGKTEVYFEAVDAAMRADKQVLILMPEIALSNAFIDRFAKRFGCRPALWHSSLTQAQRRVTYRGVAEGGVQVVIGARSALFLPFANLGAIIIDESHDASYKQEEGVTYHARDMAVVRGHFEKCPVILASATPALETMQNVWDGKYKHIHLPVRHGGAKMPAIDVIDLREHKPERQAFLSPVLLQALKETMESGAQSLLFLNRRGYAPLTLCRSCGHRFECARCTAWLVEHRATNRLECHHCGYGIKIPDACPECEDVDSLAPCGPGIERIEEEVKYHFPEARVAVLSSDSADDTHGLRAILGQMRKHELDIIIGTQILAKGHHFPKLATVGVVDADLGLHGGDLRAAERSYQLLHQVAGRAGREKGVEGHVYLQSWNPEARVIQALATGERDTFLDVEAQERKLAHMPPYARLGAIIVSGTNEREVEGFARAMAACAPHGEGVQTFGPAAAPMYRIRGRYRYRLLVHAEKNLNIQKAIRDWQTQLKVPSSLKIQVDIDPQSFL